MNTFKKLIKKFPIPFILTNSNNIFVKNDDLRQYDGDKQMGGNIINGSGKAVNRGFYKNISKF